MNGFTVYEMRYTGGDIAEPHLSLIPFRDADFPAYAQIYNACFREMRKSLGITPYDVYAEIGQIQDKKAQIFLLTAQGTLIGSVACCGTEIDDLIVNPAYQRQGYGGALLRWAIHRIRTQSDAPITLHAAEWNQNAVRLYLRNGFVISDRLTIRGTDDMRCAKWDS